MEKSLAKYVFVGVDTHKEDHTACTTNPWHKILGTCRVTNDSAFFGKFLDEVTNTIPKGLIPAFGLEDTDGLGRPLAQFLIQSKQMVKEVNPAKVDRERDESCHPDKSDPQYAFCISKVLVDEFFSLPDARAYYLKKLAEGKTKKQAITCLKRRLCDIICAMMRDRSEYVMPQPKDYSVFLTADPAINRSLRKNYKTYNPRTLSS